LLDTLQRKKGGSFYIRARRDENADSNDGKGDHQRGRDGD